MDGSPLEARLRDGLKEAMKARDTPAVTAHRTALAALANAEAAPVDEADQGGWRQVAGALPAEGERVELSEGDRRAVLHAHVLDRQETIDELRAHGQDDAASGLEQELAALLPYLV